MRFSKGMSFLIIIIIGSIVSIFLITSIFLIRHINVKHAPSLKNVERYMEKGHIDEALTLLSQTNSSSKTKILKAQALYFKTLEEQKKNKWKKYGTDEKDWFRSEYIDSSIEILKDVISSNDKNNTSEANFYLGLAYSEKGWYSLAETELLNAIEIDPDNIKAKLVLSTVYVNTERFTDAEDILHQGYKQHPTNPDVSKNMSVLYRYYINIPESAMVWFNRYLNNAKTNDIFINDAKMELEDLSQRYPEFSVPEPQLWRQNGKKFTARKIKGYINKK